MDFRVMTPTERMYSYKQSQQLSMQTGLIGHTAIDLKNGRDALSGRFFDFRASLNTTEFKRDYNSVIRSLGNQEQYGNMLESFDKFFGFCRQHPKSKFSGENGAEYGFRLDTKKYSYLMRCIPSQELYNFYCYCYKRELLEEHMRNAEKGIRFIGSDYRDLFYLADGDSIRVTMQDGSTRDLVCRYIDDFHVDVGEVAGGNIYHICEFAEKVEQCGYAQLTPLRSSLPELCYATIKETDSIVILKRGEVGYYKTDILSVSRKEAEEIVVERNKLAGITQAQVEAMKSGSMFGFHVPAADPANYKEDGTPIPPKRKNRQQER